MLMWTTRLTPACLAAVNNRKAVLDGSRVGEIGMIEAYPVGVVEHSCSTQRYR